MAKILLDTGSEAGKKAFEECIGKAYGIRWDVIVAALEMSASAVRVMLEVKCKCKVAVPNQWVGGANTRAGGSGGLSRT